MEMRKKRQGTRRLKCTLLPILAMHRLDNRSLSPFALHSLPLDHPINSLIPILIDQSDVVGH